MKRKPLVIAISAVSLTIALVLTIGSTWTQTWMATEYVHTHAKATKQPLATYEWRGVAAIQTPDYGQTLDMLSRDGYSTVFVAYSPQLASASPGLYNQDLSKFGGILEQHKLRLGLVAGDPSWATSAQWPEIDTMLAFAQEYNTEFGPGISAIQLDIEPYTNGTSASVTANTLAQTAQFVARNDRLGNGVPVGFTIPFWLTQDRNKTRSLLQTIASIPGGFVTIMDYRNDVNGPDGSRALAAPFFTLAQGIPVHIYIALDTTKTTPSKTTFYGRSPTDVRVAQHELDNIEQTQPAYAGQFVNDFQSLSVLS